MLSIHILSQLFFLYLLLTFVTIYLTHPQLLFLLLLLMHFKLSLQKLVNFSTTAKYLFSRFSFRVKHAYTDTNAKVSLSEF